MLLIADEVITGFGRTGRWFALGHWGIEPDLVSFAKGVTSGYLPLGGVIVSKRVHKVIEDAPADEKFMHAATYSGHPTCCAVGLANVDDHREGGPAGARRRHGQAPAGRAWRRCAACPRWATCAGWACWRRSNWSRTRAAASRRPAWAPSVVAECGKRGLITRQRAASAGPPASGDSLCLAPPLMTPEATLDRIVQIVGESIAAAT